MNRQQQNIGLFLAIFASFSLTNLDKQAFAQRTSTVKVHAVRVASQKKSPKTYTFSHKVTKKVAAKPKATHAAAKKASPKPSHHPVKVVKPAPHAAKSHKQVAKSSPKPGKGKTGAHHSKPAPTKSVHPAAKSGKQAAKTVHAVVKPGKHLQASHKPAVHAAKAPKHQAAKPVSHKHQASKPVKVTHHTAKFKAQPVHTSKPATHPTHSAKPKQQPAPSHMPQHPTHLQMPKLMMPHVVHNNGKPTAKPRIANAAPLAQASHGTAPDPMAWNRSTAANWRAGEENWFAARPPGAGEAPTTFDGVGRPQHVATAAPLTNSTEVRPATRETPGITYIAEGGKLVDNGHVVHSALSAQAQRSQMRSSTGGRFVPHPDEELVSTIQQKIVSFTKRFLGLPYVYGAASPRVGFDCSGLVMYVYQHFRVNLPHRADLQFNYGHHIDKRNLKPGDLVFFRELGGSDIGHVGIYVGNQSFIHASTTGKPIQYGNLQAANYQRRYMGATRLAN